MMQANSPMSHYKSPTATPKPSSSHRPTRTMTESEQAQAYRELLAIHEQIAHAEEIRAKAQDTKVVLAGQFNALLTRGLVASGRASVGACQSCGYLNCNCERLG